jgi:choline dehydrogenase-like flavoprotein
MLSELSTIPAGTTLEADLCIIGAGAAGIAIAREFIASPYRVILLESGGNRREPATQQLYGGTSIGQPYHRLDECRSRRFGGSTNCWGGICTPLNEIDFERRSWVSWSGWPLDSAELAPHYSRAHHLCGTGPFLYDARAWDRIGLEWRNFDRESFEPFVWHYNTRSQYDISFGKRFRHELERASNIFGFMYANVTGLLTGESGRAVERVRVATLDGQIRYVRAKAFVLACGGIENPRILLASNEVHPDGLGNSHDLVGRFFQEHLEAPCGLLQANKAADVSRYSELARLGETSCLPGLVLSKNAQTKFRTLNGSLSLDPIYDPEGGLAACWGIRKDLRARHIDSSLLRRLWRAARDTRIILPEAWRRAAYGFRPRGIPDRFLVFARAEQAPNPESRVTLASDTDQLGMRRACLDWRTGALDREGIRLMASLAAEEFTRLGLGQVIAADWLESGEWPSEMLGGPHHMGTTRMSDDPRTGVVDRHCKVHDVDRLFVAGSSVFPTGGHANPTLTIIALAMRLAGHIRNELAAQGTVNVSVNVSVASEPQASCPQ